MKPAEVFPEDNSAAERVLAATGRVAELNARAALLEKELETGDVPAVVRALQKVEAALDIAEKELAEDRQVVASPLSEAWGNCRTLLAALDSATDPLELRQRRRTALRRTVEQIWCIFVSRGRQRLAAVQVWFQGGRHRDYLILHTPTHANKDSRTEKGWRAWSFADAAVPGSLDLRNATDAAQLAAVLERIDLAGMG